MNISLLQKALNFDKNQMVWLQSENCSVHYSTFVVDMVQKMQQVVLSSTYHSATEEYYVLVLLLTGETILVEMNLAYETTKVSLLD